MVKMIKIIFILSLLCAFSQAEDVPDTSSPSKIEKLKEFGENAIMKIKEYYFKFFQGLEDYTIQSHNMLKNTFGCEHPYDLFVYFSIGMLLKFFFSFFSFKQNYVYNLPDDSESVAYINNKIKELSSILKKSKKEKDNHIFSEEALGLPVGVVVKSESIAQIEEKADDVNRNLDMLINEITEGMIGFYLTHDKRKYKEGGIL